MNASAPNPRTTSHCSAADARAVLAVHAYEVAGDAAVWTAEDSAWATRLAREQGAAGQPPAAALALRARHALQRLLPRQPALQTLLAAAGRPAPGLLLVPLAGLLVGLAADAIGSSQRINLLAPPVWGVVLWNLAVYLGLLLQRPALPRGLRALLQRWLAPAPRGSGGDARALRVFTAAWAQAAAPAHLARAALLLHLGAAALALGLIAGMYLRGLVLDYRAGWQSTFLEPATVRAVLAGLLAPASALTGIPVPDAAAVAALRQAPDAPPTASAAPWLHLYAATLALAVLLPRALLAAAAAWRVRHLGRAVPLPLHEPALQRVLRALQGGTARVQVLPCGAAPVPQATLGVRDWLAAACGEGLDLQVAPALAYGSEEQPSPPAPGSTLRVLLVDLSSTPEPDRHGRALQALRAQSPGTPLLVLGDEAGFRQRFGALPARLEERRATWRRFAADHAAAWVGVDLTHPDVADAEAYLDAALRAAAAPAAGDAA